MIKKISIMAIMLLLLFSLTACDTTDDPEKVIDVICETHYVNTTESWTVMSHNGYKAIEFTKKYDKEKDVYTVTLKFVNPLSEVKKDE